MTRVWPSFVRFQAIVWLISQFQIGLVPVSIAPSKERAFCNESRRYLHLLFHRCLPFSPFMSIFRRCSSSRPLTVSGRCVSRNRIYGYVHTLIGEKNPSSEGWFIQSWRSRKAVAIGCTRLTSSGAVEGCQLPTRGQSPGKRCLGEAFISQRYCDPYRTLRSPPPLHTHTHPSRLFVFWGCDRTLTHLLLLFAALARRARDPHIIYSRQDGVLRTTLCGHVVLGARIASALWVRRCWRAALDASSRCAPAIEEVDDGSFVPCSPPFPSTPMSSYSTGTSTSGRNSEDSSVVGVGALC